MAIKDGQGIQTIDDFFRAAGIRQKVSKKQFNEFNAQRYFNIISSYASSDFLHLNRMSARYWAKMAGWEEGLGYLTRLIDLKERSPNGNSKKLREMAGLKQRIKYQVEQLKKQESAYSRTGNCYIHSNK